MSYTKPVHNWPITIDAIHSHIQHKCCQCDNRVLDYSTWPFCDKHKEAFNTWFNASITRTGLEASFIEYDQYSTVQQIKDSLVLQYLNGYIDTGYISGMLSTPICHCCSDSLLKFDVIERAYVEEYEDPTFNEVCRICAVEITDSYGFDSFSDFLACEYSQFDLYDWLINSRDQAEKYFLQCHFPRKIFSEINAFIPCEVCGKDYPKEYVGNYLQGLNPVTKGFKCARCY